MTSTLIERLSLAEKLYQGEMVVLSGGQTRHETAVEADVMAQWLLKRGIIPADRLLLERKSVNTRQNLLNALRLFGDELKPAEQVRIITSDFHCWRTTRLSAACGLSGAAVCGSRTMALIAPMYHLREVLAIIYARSGEKERGRRMTLKTKLPSFVAVPSDIIDEHLGKASGLYIKVILYILRTNKIDPPVIAAVLSVPVSDVEEAIRYWTSSGILPAEEVERQLEAGKKQQVQAAQLPRGSSDSPETVETSYFKVSADREEVRFLLTTAEQILGRPLSSTEQKGFVFFFGGILTCLRM